MRLEELQITEPPEKGPTLEILRSVVFTPAGAPALQKAKFYCGAGALAGLESQRIGSLLCSISDFCNRLNSKPKTKNSAW